MHRLLILIPLILVGCAPEKFEVRSKKLLASRESLARLMPCSELTMDFTGDGNVNWPDFEQFASHWQDKGPCRMDFDNNSIVDWEDFQAFSGQWYCTCMVRISGYVRDANGNPIGGVKITAETKRNETKGR